MRGLTSNRLVIALSAFTFCAQALAQTGATSASASQSNKAALEEIIVTAQKRQENLQDVPIAVTAVTGENLTSNHASTSLDLQSMVPGFVMTSVAGSPQVSLRGIGSSITQPATDLAVTTYIDGAVIGNLNAAITNLMGLERIEVLKGPQGTLYGRNSVGGAINMITKSPTQDLDLGLSLSAGNYSRREAAFHVSGGVTETLALGLYAAGTQRDSYLDFEPAPFRGPLDKQTDDQENWGVRVKGVYTPAEWLKLTLSAEKMEERVDDLNAVRQIEPRATGFAFAPPPIIDEYTVSTDWPPVQHGEHEAYNLRGEIDMGWANLLSISNYRDDYTLAVVDADATTADLADLSSKVKAHQWSQELQLLSPTESPVQWIGGLYYFEIDDGYLPSNPYRPTNLPPTVPNTVTYSTVATKSYAGFAQATIPLSWIEGMRLTLGGRYTHDEKKWNVRREFRNAAGGQALPALEFPEIEDSWKKFTPKVTLDYRVNDTLFYIGWSRGFRSGAFNTFDPTQQSVVDPETLDAYEIGSKSQLFDDRIRLNLSAYYYDYKDLQVTSTDPATLQGIFVNAASAEAYGLDGEFQWAATEHLTLSANALLSRSEYKEFDNFLSFGPNPNPTPFPYVNVLIDASGNDIERAPEFSGTIAADYLRPLPNGGQLGLRGSWYYNDGYFWAPNNLLSQDSYDLLNASVEYIFPDGRWSVTAWGTNLTDSYHSNMLFTIGTTGSIVTDAAPRMYGLTIKFSVK